jgi:hypothetical protein
MIISAIATLSITLTKESKTTRPLTPLLPPATGSSMGATTRRAICFLMERTTIFMMRKAAFCATQQASTGGDMTGYLYAPDGFRLAKSTLTSFSCDMNKNRVLTANGPVFTNLYTVGPDGEQLGEIGQAITRTICTTMCFWEGKLLGTYTGSTYAESNWHFALNDWLGTKQRQIVTSAGAPSTSFFSGPFGDYLSQNGSGPI